MSVRLTTRQVGAVTIIDVVGRVTAGESSGSLGDYMRELVRSGHNKLLLNLAELSYIDSAGIGALVGPVALQICPQCSNHYCVWLHGRCPKCRREIAPNEVKLVRRDGMWKAIVGRSETA